MQIVPQYIDVEDRIVGPLTWKHLGWFFGAAGILLIAFTIFDRMTFYIIAIPIIGIAVTLAFARPNGVSMSEFIGYGINFLFHPKVYTWEREIKKNEIKKKNKDIQISTTSKEKMLSIEDITAISQTLDSRGKARNERIQQIMKEQLNKNK
jgi:hypothetical protein